MPYLFITFVVVFLVKVAYRSVGILLNRVLTMLYVRVGWNVSSFMGMGMITTQFREIFAVQAKNTKVGVFIAIALNVIRTRVRIRARIKRGVSFVIGLNVPSRKFSF